MSTIISRVNAPPPPTFHASFRVEEEGSTSICPLCQAPTILAEADQQAVREPSGRLWRASLALGTTNNRRLVTPP